MTSPLPWSCCVRWIGLASFLPQEGARAQWGVTGPHGTGAQSCPHSPDAPPQDYTKIHKEKRKLLWVSRTGVPGFLPPSFLTLSFQIPVQDLPRLIFTTIQLAQFFRYSPEITQTSQLLLEHLPSLCFQTQCQAAGGQGRRRLRHWEVFSLCFLLPPS